MSIPTLPRPPELACLVRLEHCETGTAVTLLSFILAVNGAFILTPGPFFIHVFTALLWLLLPEDLCSLQCVKLSFHPTLRNRDGTLSPPHGWGTEGWRGQMTWPRPSGESVTKQETEHGPPKGQASSLT